jgi:GcrA cell cycle regulator
MTRGVHTGNGRDWPAERIEKLRGLAAAGLSAREMGNKMGMSRNSVLGKCYRLGIVIQRQVKGPKRRLRAEVGNVRITLNTPRRPGGARPMAIHAAATLQPPEPITEPTLGSAVTIMGLTDKTCRWPLGEPSPEMLYCGAATEFGSYCPFHSRKAHKVRGEPDDRPQP